MFFDKLNHFLIVCTCRHGKFEKKRYDVSSFFEISAGQFANNEGMTCNSAIVQQLFQTRRSGSQVLYPD